MSTELTAKEWKDRKWWGYKGKGTAINGLTNWLNNKHAGEFHGTTNSRYDQQCELIIKYAKECIPKYKRPGGSPQYAADWIAQKIEKNNKFDQFTQWVEKYFNPTPTTANNLIPE